jgi:Xaa-Pro aminopeptidase
MSPARLPLFHFAQSYTDSDQYYLTGFLCSDPFAVLELPGGRTIAAVSAMEYGRAEKESKCDELDLLIRGKNKNDRPESAVVDFLKKRGANHICVLPSFPVGLARYMENEGVYMEVDSKSVKERRRAKSAEEIGYIESVQRKTEGAMEMARSFLAGCPVRKGVLQYEGSDLTAEKLRSLIEIFLLERGLDCVDSIVAPGRTAANPHNRGLGPIHAGVPIVIDLFPRDRVTRYHSDMSRTFVVGPASCAVRDMHNTVVQAQDVALERLEPGVLLPDVHRAVCDVFQARGYRVPGAPGKVLKRGFLHSTGHGLGLDVHEAPSVSPEGDELRPGDVITIEPGLYDSRIGGVRIEDVVVVTAEGEVRNLTRFDRELEIK